MNKDKKAALIKLIGQAKADEVEQSLDENTRAAAEPGVVMRQTQTQASQSQPAPTAPAAAAAQAPAAEAPVQTRAFSDDDVTALASALFGSDTFKSSVKDIVTEMRDAEPDGDEDSDEAPVEEPAEARTLGDDLATKILAKLDELGKSREAEVQQVLDDLPTRIAKARIIRPRGEVQIQPGALQVEERTQLDLSAIAEQTRGKVFAGTK